MIASRAPSVHNPQPWLWWIGDHVIQPHADMARRVALAALGVDHHVDRLPDPVQPDLLARVRLGPGSGRRHATGVDPGQVGAVMDRRPYLDWPAAQRDGRAWGRAPATVTLYGFDDLEEL